MTSAVPVASVYFLTALAGLGLCLRVARDSTPVARELLGLAAAVSVWALFDGIGTLSRTVFYHQLWAQFAYIGAYSIGAFLLRFAVKWLWPRQQGWWLSLVWLMPAVIVIAAFTNEIHGLVWPFIRPSESNPHLWVYGHGPVFWVAIVYEYAVIGTSGILLVAAAWTYRGVYRQQTLYVMGGLVVAVVGNIVYLVGLLPVSLDITPMTLAVSTGFIIAGVSRARLLDILPAVRHRVVDLMPDGLLILDTESRIMDWNAAALSMWNIHRPDLTGTPVSEVLEPWDERIAPGLSVTTSGVFRTILLVPGENGLRTHIDVEVRPFSIRHGGNDGWIVMIRDASLIRRAERDLQAANDRLEALNKMLLSQAIHDSLTGLFNRAYLDEALARELARCRRDGSSIGLLILDVDNFKDVNDTNGHEVGDLVLKEVARLVRGIVRAGDIPCRFGGDEIVAVMPGSSRTEARLVAERIRQRVSEEEFSADGQPLAVTVSVGVAIFPDHADSAAELFRAADRALYSAKDAGRNRTVTANE